jgi:hypothetical protein
MNVQCVNDVKIWTPGGDANVLAMGTFMKFIAQLVFICKQLYWFAYAPWGATLMGIQFIPLLIPLISRRVTTSLRFNLRQETFRSL